MSANYFVNLVVNQSEVVHDKGHGIVRIGVVHDKGHEVVYGRLTPDAERHRKALAEPAGGGYPPGAAGSLTCNVGPLDSPTIHARRREGFLILTPESLHIHAHPTQYQ